MTRWLAATLATISALALAASAACVWGGRRLRRMLP